MAAGGSSSAVVPAFDPDKYRPLPHEFEPVGLKLYQQKSRKINKHRKKKARILDNEAVPREPEIHFSVKNKEIWSYEFLRMHVPKNSYADPLVIPRGLKWARDSRGKKEGRKNLTTYRLFLDQLTKEHVNWDVWTGVDPMVHADLLRSGQANGRRILLEGPFCRQWYLGERVVRQSLGYDVFRVPKPIPSSMLNTRSLTVEDVARWTKGEDAATFLEESGDYEEHMVQRLTPVLGVSRVQRGPPPGPHAVTVPLTATEAAPTEGGAEVPIDALSVELPQLPWQVDYYSRTGQRRYIEIPSPEHGDFTLPPNVQQVPREYVEACFRNISGLRVLVRQQAMTDKTVRPPQLGSEDEE
ncbi:hypothetical protein RHSIM_Rhsim05G0049200 [Rhododendron simsii]|uniref:Uncharacterized protein n=1 Tax=Rhododendron simsii TaxID=118357 RepID=A0A834LMK2_RHOSS|nr:hypothetical protein RHSIM_Rhsim05G0049200 [Rhododendron simsii]